MGAERIFVARLVGLAVFGPDGERIGKVRDLVAALRVDASPPRVLGAGGRAGHPPADLRADAAGHHDRPRRGHAGHRLGQPARVRRSAPTRRCWSASCSTPRSGCVDDRRGDRRRRRGHRADPLAGLGRQPAGRAGPPPRVRPARARCRCVPWRAVTGLTLVRPAGHRRAAVGVRDHAPGRRRRRAAELPEKRQFEVDRRARRRAARRRVRGAVRVRPAGAARATWTPSGPRTCSRRCPPTTPPTCCTSCPTPSPTRCWR